MAKQQKKGELSLQDKLINSHKLQILIDDTQTFIMQDQLNRRSKEIIELRELNEKLKKRVETEKKERIDEIRKIEEDNTKLEVSLIEMEKQAVEMNKELEELEENHNKTMITMKANYERDEKDLREKIAALKERQDIANQFQASKSLFEDEVAELKQTLEREKQRKLQELDLKEEEIVLATDKLNKIMLHQIQETKTSLFAIKKEQLDPTTRITVYQNHQLTSELEYQSKQTEQLLFKSQKLSEQVKALKRDVDIHKQVESELAKRSHYCERLMLKLKEKEESLRADRESVLGNLEAIRKEKEKFKVPEETDPLDKENKLKMIPKQIEFLEETLNKTEHEVAHLQNEYDILYNQNDTLKVKANQNKANMTNIAKILLYTLESVSKSTSEDLYEDAEYKINIKDIKEKQFANLDPEIKRLYLLCVVSHFKRYLPLIADLNIPKIECIDNAAAYNTRFMSTNFFDETQKFDVLPLDLKTKIIRSNMMDIVPDIVYVPPKKRNAHTYKTALPKSRSLKPVNS